MSSGIDPRTDYVFKRLFASEGHEALLADVINAVVGFPAGKLAREVRVTNPFTEVDFAEEKVSILDIRAKEQSGRHFNLEMERHPLWFFGKRALYYWADVHGSQLLEGEHYATIRPTYSICFLNGPIFPDDNYHHRFRLIDTNNGVTLCKDLEIHIVELNKFTVAAENIKTQAERWCYFLKHGETLDRDNLPATLDNPLIRQALEVLYMLNQSEIERQRYLERVRVNRDELTLRYLAEHGHQLAELALKEGREEGYEEGYEKAQLNGLIAQIGAIQRLTKQPMTPREELLRLSIDALQALALQLEQQALSAQNDVSP